VSSGADTAKTARSHRPDVTENRSLDDFVGGDAATDGASDGDDEAADADESVEDADGPPAGDESATDAADGPAGNEADEPAEGAADESAEDTAEDAVTEDALDVSPAVATYRWDPAGVACPACGETVDRLWLDDGEQVCADCKAW
jgi:hypothetical protein